jgi:hypothetical protein
MMGRMQVNGIIMEDDLGKGFVMVRQSPLDRLGRTFSFRG